MNYDAQTGVKAFQLFHNYSTKYPNYGLTWSDFQRAYGSNFEIYAEGVGMVINLNGLSDSQVDSAMEALANTSQGRLPKDHQGYANALQGQASQVSYLDLAWNVTKDVATGVGDGVVAFGESVTTTLSVLNKMLPFIVIGGVLFYVFNISKGGSKVDLGGVAGKLKTKLKKVLE